MKKGIQSNKGFSLVELIIVIAIMAILVGVMAPQLIKYIEKSNVSADVQLCDSIKQAILLAGVDPEYLSSGETYFNTYTSGGNYGFFAGNGSGTLLTSVFETNVDEILGFQLRGADGPDKYIRSSASNKNGAVYFVVNSDGTDFAIYISHSDITGRKADNGVIVSYDDLESSGLIYSK